MKSWGVAGLAACAVLAISGCGRIRLSVPDVQAALPRFPSMRSDRSTLPILNEEAFAKKPMRAYRIPTPKPGEIPAQTVIGEMTSHRIRTGETLLDVARYYDLGMNEIIDANPGVDIWSPKVGTTVVVPTQWILPCCTYEGMYPERPGNAAVLLREGGGRPVDHRRAHLPPGLGPRRSADAEGQLHGDREDREPHLGDSRAHPTGPHP